MNVLCSPRAPHGGRGVPQAKGVRSMSGWAAGIFKKTLSKMTCARHSLKNELSKMTWARHSFEHALFILGSARHSFENDYLFWDRDETKHSCFCFCLNVLISKSRFWGFANPTN